jgi:hypothetical protein
MPQPEFAQPLVQVLAVTPAGAVPSVLAAAAVSSTALERWRPRGYRLPGVELTAKRLRADGTRGG